SGLTQLMEWGIIETPIFLTNTLSVGQVSDAAVEWMVNTYPGIGDEHDVLIPLVGECDDSWLNDVAGRHVRAENVSEALQTASRATAASSPSWRPTRRSARTSWAASPSASLSRSAAPAASPRTARARSSSPSPPPTRSRARRRK